MSPDQPIDAPDRGPGPDGRSCRLARTRGPGFWSGLLAAVALALAPGAALAGVERSAVDRPDDVQGAQIHLVYALPSDGHDRQLDTNGTIEKSWSAAQAWLAQQTDGLAFRLDTADGAPDITYFRLSKPQDAVAAEGAYVRDLIEAELKASGIAQPDKLYLVFYDGTSTWACGGGAWPPTLPGNTAALYLHGAPAGARPCDTNAFSGPGGSPGYWEFSELHELIHTLGFVPECAPHHTRAGHVSDYPTDLMYAGSEPWRPDSLDIGGDDYYGHDDPGCPDLADSPYLTRLDTSVDATIASAAVRKRGARRWAQIVLAAREPVIGTARLVRAGKVLASRKFTATAPRTMRLRIPKRVSGGTVRLQIELQDHSGNTATLTKRIRILSRG